MTYVNEFDIDKVDITDGRRAEANFVALFKNKFGVEPIKSPDFVDKCNHIDFYMQVKNHRASVDVKSWKNDPDYVWIEFISYGRLGWLYGQADYIGFETPNEKNFIMVNRKKLIEFVMKNVIVDFITDKNLALYKLYIRFKGKDSEHYDCITKIPRERLLEIDHWIL